MDSVKINGREVSLLNLTVKEKQYLIKLSEIGKSSKAALSLMCDYCKLNKLTLKCNKCPIETYLFNLKYSVNNLKEQKNES